MKKRGERYNWYSEKDGVVCWFASVCIYMIWEKNEEKTKERNERSFWVQSKIQDDA